jgi:hypothetical protein
VAESQNMSASTAFTNMAPGSTKSCLPPPEVVVEKSRSRRRRTAVFVCFGVLFFALVSLIIGVALHFLLETGIVGASGQNSESNQVYNGSFFEAKK